MSSDLQIDIDKKEPAKDIKPHNGSEITIVSVSPNGTYVATYSEEDQSIVGWNIDKFDHQVTPLKLEDEVEELKISDHKLVVICKRDEMLKIYQLGINNVKINNEFRYDADTNESYNFSRNGELVHCQPKKNQISVYLPHAIKDKLKLKTVYAIYSGDNLRKCGITNEDKIWANSSHYLYFWDLNTLQFECCYASDQYNIINLSTNKNFILVNNGDSINFYSIIFLRGFSIPIRIIRNYFEKLLFMNKKDCNYFLALSYDIKLYDIFDKNKAPVDVTNLFSFELRDYNLQTNRAYGLNEEKTKISTIGFGDQNWEEYFTPNYDEDDIILGWDHYLDYNNYEDDINDSLIYPDIENIQILLKDSIYEHVSTDINFHNSLYKWNIDQKDMNIHIYKNSNKGWILICSKYIYYEPTNWIILKNDALVLCLDIPHYEGFTVFKFNKNDIQLQYLGCIEDYENGPQKSESSSYFIREIIKYGTSEGYYPLAKEWLQVIMTDYFILLKYGSKYFKAFINNMRATDFITNTYNKCITLIKKDTKKNFDFLNIITLSLLELIEQNQDYLDRFNSDMLILLDPTEGLGIISSNHHIYSYYKKVDCIQISMWYYHLNNIYNRFILNPFNNFKFFFESFKPFFKFYNNYNRYICLICAYNNFSCYPSEYSWWKELFYKPQSSSFIDTCHKRFYNNWNGEAILDFKWRVFGKYYYFYIWFQYLVFLNCFIFGSLPIAFNTNEIRIQLYQATIVLGIIHLYFEFRQFVWSPQKYIISIWNFFDLSAYFLPVFASYYWLINNNVPDWAISISCLFLNMKFLLFFHAFESFGVYFSIIFGVAYRVFSFLVVLFIILASFALSFYLLLYPNLLHKIPGSKKSEEPKLFESYPTALLAMYLFLTGDTSLLSSSNASNVILIILLVLFSFLVVIYLMNLFIGLLNLAIDKDNDRVSYLIQKAEILAEIELFYLLPFQRRWKDWFPETIHFKVRIDIARKYVREAIENGKWKTDDCPEYRTKVLKLLDMYDLIDDE